MSSKSRKSSTVVDDYKLDEPEPDHKESRSKLATKDKLMKRRNQNGIRQRAFRQRQEKHTKELEVKVEELETLLESASHENSIVTSQMRSMEEELYYYRNLLFVGAYGQGLGISPLPSDTSTSMSYTQYPATYSPIRATAGVATNSYVSSSANSSPLSNIPGDFSAGANGFETFSGYNPFEALDRLSNTTAATLRGNFRIYPSKRRKISALFTFINIDLYHIHDQQVFLLTGAGAVL